MAAGSCHWPFGGLRRSAWREGSHLGLTFSWITNSLLLLSWCQRWLAFCHCQKERKGKTERNRAKMLQSRVIASAYLDILFVGPSTFSAAEFRFFFFFFNEAVSF